MQKNILVYGLITGALVSASMVVMMNMLTNSSNFESSEVLGYASMILAFSLIFVGIRDYRNKQAGGQIGFWQAFKMGSLIALIGSTMYVITWLVYYHNFIPDFMEKYSAHVLKTAAEQGATQAQLDAKTQEMAHFTEMYKNPFWQVVLSFMEILPVGLAVALLSALILKRK